MQAKPITLTSRSHGALGGVTHIAILLALLTIPLAPAMAETTPLDILHAPVVVAPEGQNIAVRARVSGGAQPLEQVTLMWAPSRDTAPFRIAMEDTGTAIYSGTVPATLFTGLHELYYYIEARDAEGITAETPWYTVAVRPLKANPANATTTRPAEQPSGTKPAPDPDDKSSKWVKPALIGGGLLAAGGAAYLLTQDSGGSDGGEAPIDPPPSAKGTYIGNVTTCFQPQGSNIVCSAQALTMVIDADNLVQTSDLTPGETLGARLSGSSFVFAVPVDDAFGTGEIQYIGTVIDTRIVGTVQGSSTSPSGGIGTYSGTFTATRR